MTLVLIVPAIVVLVLATRQAIEATARIQSALKDPDKALPMHAGRLGSRPSSQRVAICGLLAAASARAQKKWRHF